MKLEENPVSKILIATHLKSTLLGWGMVLLFVAFNVFGALTLKNQIQKFGDSNLTDVRSYFFFLVKIVASVPTMIAIGSLFAATIAWMVALANLDLSKAYPVAIGCNFLTVMASATLIYGEPMNFLKITGVVFILAGIISILKC